MSSITNASASLPAQIKVVGSQRYEKGIDDIIKILHDETRPPFYNEKPRDERELKAVVHAICRCVIDPYVRRERGGARVADKEYKFDFSIFSDRDALEVKLITEKHSRGEVVAEITEDINAFKNSQFENLLFLIYDSIGDISDEVAFKQEFEKGNIHVIIRKH